MTDRATAVPADEQADMVVNYFRNQLKPPGRRMLPKQAPSIDRFSKYDRLDQFNHIEQALGKRAKRTLDHNRGTQNYYSAQAVHRPTLDHYEDMDWWERDASHDFFKYVDGNTRVSRG